jgi:hypothetical protein
VADFYVPEVGLCIECWADQLEQKRNRAAVINAELEKHVSYKKHKVPYVEFSNENIHQIDEVLARELLRRGLAVY